jgi:formylglycine-generating enzyme required for sulfatase activity
VENVGWEDAMEFCNRLSQRTGRHYTLPSEAQWEYACRARTSTPFHYGETITPELANYDSSYAYANGPTREKRAQTTPVGMFPANAWGLYDMHGNVLEWCLDYIHYGYNGAPSDGSAWLNPIVVNRVLRGGSWFLGPLFCRAANRFSSHPALVLPNPGVRPCCLLPPGPLLGS